jgi:putative Mg2+ transporter-C (MgtC) family protein
MQSASTLEAFLSLILAVVLGVVVCIERETTHKPAGFRAHMLGVLGSCLFTIVSISFSVDPARIVGVFTGIGFFYA